MNSGNARQIARSSWSRLAVVSSRWLEVVIQVLSWSPRSVSASNTVPVLLIASCVARSWEFRTFSTSFVLFANPGSTPRKSEKSAPWSSMPFPRSCCQIWKPSRVFLSNARKISSSSTVGATWAVSRRPSSGMSPAESVPGVSSM